MNTPYGSVDWQHNGGNNWTQNVTESDNQRDLRVGGENLGIGLNNLGLDQLGRVNSILGTNYDPGRFNVNDATGGKLDLSQALGGNFGSVYDPTKLGVLDTSKYDPKQLGNFEDDVRARSFALASQGLDKQFERGDEALRTRLANQGISAGSDAFGAEQAAFQEGKGNAYAKALLAADSNAMQQRGQAVSELGQGFGQDLAGRAQSAGLMGQGFNQYLANRGQNLSELLTERGTNLGEAQTQFGYDQQSDLLQRQTPLNEILALMNGGTSVASPINPGQSPVINQANTDVAGINANAWNAQNAAYQNKMSGYNALWGSLAGLGGAYLGRGG